MRVAQGVGGAEAEGALLARTVIEQVWGWPALTPEHPPSPPIPYETIVQSFFFSWLSQVLVSAPEIKLPTSKLAS